MVKLNEIGKKIDYLKRLEAEHDKYLISNNMKHSNRLLIKAMRKYIEHDNPNYKHICNSHKPSTHPKIAKELAMPSH